MIVQFVDIGGIVDHHCLSSHNLQEICNFLILTAVNVELLLFIYYNDLDHLIHTLLVR